MTKYVNAATNINFKTGLCKTYWYTIVGIGYTDKQFIHNIYTSILVKPWGNVRLKMVPIIL